MDLYDNLISKIIEDKEEDVLEEKEKEKDMFRDLSAQDRIPNIKRKNTKFHSNIVNNVGGLKKTNLRKQKSGSVIIIPSSTDIPMTTSGFYDPISIIFIKFYKTTINI